MNHSFKVLFALVVGLGVTLGSVRSDAGSEELISRLRTLSESTDLAAYAGPQGRVLEAVNLSAGAGIAVLYFDGAKECAGKWVVMPSEPDKFYPDTRCGSGVQIQSENGKKMAVAVPSRAKSDVQILLHAVRFTARIPAIYPEIREVIGAAFYDGETTRVLITYRTKDNKDVCRISLTSAASGHSWTVSSRRAACQIQ